MSNQEILHQLRYKRDNIKELISLTQGDKKTLLEAEFLYVIAQIEYREKHLAS